LARTASGRTTQLLVVSDGLHRIAASDRIAPAKATVLGPVHVIPQELPHIACRSIDIPSLMSAPEIERTASQLIDELGADASDPVVAYRNVQRLVRTFEPLTTPSQDSVKLRHRGVYLITGGLGGVGVSLAEYLVRSCQARVVIVARSLVPPRDQWDSLTSAQSPDRTGRMIRRLQSLERLGAEVIVEQADVGDPQQIRRVVQRSRDRLGRIDGVIHCAGVAGGGMLQRKTLDAASAVMRPKVNGTMALVESFGTDAPDFFVLCSSLTSVLGGFGQVDYCAANAFLDAYAHAAAGEGTRFISINWDTWREAGMAVDTSMPAELEAVRQENLRQGLTNPEGVEIWRRALAAGVPQVVVSTRDLRTRMAGSMTTHHVTNNPDRDVTIAARPPLEHARPNLETLYEAAETPVEIIVCAIWEELLGVTPIGVNDDFFDLGGHSLLAVQVTSRLRQVLDVEVPVQVLFDAATAKRLAADVERRLAATEAGRARLDELVAHIARLGDEDVGLTSHDRAEGRA
jgi:NAD(P)-dependent dehydrogenase (short-subunit alcohol dehydrogenase family)